MVTPILDQIEFAMDKGTILVVGILGIIYALYHIINAIKCRQANKQQDIVNKEIMDALQERKSCERAINSLYRFWIDMEMDEMLEKEGLI